MNMSKIDGIAFRALLFFFVCVCMCMCVFRVGIWAPFIHREKVPSFLTITLVDLGKS